MTRDVKGGLFTNCNHVDAFMETESLALMQVKANIILCQMKKNRMNMQKR